MKSLTSLLVAFTLVVTHAQQAFALAGPLNRPSIGYPANNPVAKARIDKVMKILNDKKFQYVQGHFVNEISTMN